MPCACDCYNTHTHTHTHTYVQPNKNERMATQVSCAKVAVHIHNRASRDLLPKSIPGDTTAGQTASMVDCKVSIMELGKLSAMRDNL